MRHPVEAFFSQFPHIRGGSRSEPVPATDEHEDDDADDDDETPCVVVSTPDVIKPKLEDTKKEWLFEDEPPHNTTAAPIVAASTQMPCPPPKDEPGADTNTTGEKRKDGTEADTKNTEERPKKTARVKSALETAFEAAMLRGKQFLTLVQTAETIKDTAERNAQPWWWAAYACPDIKAALGALKPVQLAFIETVRYTKLTTLIKDHQGEAEALKYIMRLDADVTKMHALLHEIIGPLMGMQLARAGWEAPALPANKRKKTNE